jgi:hypothetical protein
MATAALYGQQATHVVQRHPEARASSGGEQARQLQHSPLMVAQRRRIGSLFARGTDDSAPPESAPHVAQLAGSDSDSDWSGSDDDNIPGGYMTPSDYQDEFGGSSHSELDGKVVAKKIQGRPALWWLAPHDEHHLHLTGARHSDIAALGGDDPGYTWHHCADYAGGGCTMQQVPTGEHASWGHIGGASQAGYGVDG